MITQHKKTYLLAILVTGLAGSASWVSAEVAPQDLDQEAEALLDLAQDAVEDAVEDVLEKVAEESIDIAIDEVIHDNAPQNIQNSFTSQIIFNNGDNLYVDDLSAEDSQSVSVQSDNLNQPAAFAIKDIRSVLFPQIKSSVNEKETARIELQSRYSRPEGDVIIGELVELTSEHIIIRANHSGDLKIKRSMVQSFNIIQQGVGSYYGPSSIDEWKMPDKGNLDKEAQWSFSEQKLIAKGVATAGKDVGLTKNNHIGFQISYETSLNFSLNFFTNEPKRSNPKTGYAFRIRGNNASISTFGTRVNRAAGFGQRSQRINIDNISKTAQVDLFTNTDIGIIYVYIDGNQQCTLNLPKLKELGSGITFCNQSESKVSVQDININPWDGTNLPRDVTGMSEQPHIISLRNGDQIPGKVGKVEDGFMLVETDYTPVRIPINKIKSLNLTAESEQPIMKNGDVKVSLNNGSFMVIQLTKLTDTHLSGYGQAIGNVEIDLATVRRIDFNIYSH